MSGADHSAGGRVDSRVDRLVARPSRRVALTGHAQRPVTGVAIVSCMDARLNVFSILGLTEGDAHVIRNAGGCATDDAIRSLALSQRATGTREVLLLHHEHCAAVADPDVDLARCLGVLRASAELPYTGAIRGFVYEAGGGLREGG